jgi:hypothetical protein
VLIVIISCLLEPTLACIQRHNKNKEYKLLEWSLNSTLQLQRLAYQGVNSGTWTGYSDSVPKTTQVEVLKNLVLSYPLSSSENAATGGESGSAGKRSCSPKAAVLPGSDTHSTISQTEILGPQNSSVVDASLAIASKYTVKAETRTASNLEDLPTGPGEPTPSVEKSSYPQAPPSTRVVLIDQSEPVTPESALQLCERSV